MQEDLELLLFRSEHYQRELAVRRYLDDFIGKLDEKLEERSDRASGSIPFNPNNWGDKGMTSKYGKVARFLSEKTDYVQDYTNYSIDPENLDDLRKEAENIRSLPTTEEEQGMIVDILEGRKLNQSELKEELYERLDYEPSDTMINQRVDMIEEIEIDEEDKYTVRV